MTQDKQFSIDIELKKKRILTETLASQRINGIGLKCVDSRGNSAPVNLGIAKMKRERARLMRGA